MGDPSSAHNARSYHANMYSHSFYGSNGVPPPNGPSRRESMPYGMPTNSTNGTRNGVKPGLSASTSDPAMFGEDLDAPTAIVIRRLPGTIDVDAIGTMLIFASDLIDIRILQSPWDEDHGMPAAGAWFRTNAGAVEAQRKLHGKPNSTKLHLKPNTTKEKNQMIVQLYHERDLPSFERRNTVDGSASRAQTSSTSSSGSGGGPPSKSRYVDSFACNEYTSPPLTTGSSSGSGSGGSELPVPETSSHLQNLFSLHSPLTNGVHDRHRVSGKSMINDDSADDETGELLKDPLAYARNGQQMLARRTTDPHPLESGFGRLSLSTGNGNGIGSPMAAGMVSPRESASMQSPASALSPAALNAMGLNGAYPSSYPNAQYPPVNPADQNPPCNTLYVGNLPPHTSEDELKTLFTKQRGYRRLCFRTKQNGPMCFVEFEDVSFATKALNELYGHLLHNSVKGGIRLSFSKNPLGVRSGQMNGMGPNAAMTPQAMSPGYGGFMNNVSFSSVMGPPPGLAMPPGLPNGNGYRPPPPTSMDGMFTNPFGMPSHDFANQLTPRAISGGVPAQLGNGTFDRENRGGYSDYMMGR